MDYLENFKKEIALLQEIRAKVPEFPLTDEQKKVLQNALNNYLLLKEQHLNQSQSDREFVNKR